MIDFNINELLFLNDSLAHKIDNQLETINCLQEENKKLHAELTDSKNDLKQAHIEIKRLNNQIGNLLRNIGYLCEENRKLRDTINAYEQLF